MTLRPERPDFGVTTLGSGGPFSNAVRVSAGYCIWIAGRPSLIVDAGGGSYSRLGQAEIPVAEIETIAFSHTHIDHTGGLPPTVLAAVMAGHTGRFTFVGPSERAPHPGAGRFIELLFGRDGAWGYLHDFPGFEYEIREVPSNPNVRGTIVRVDLPETRYALYAVAVRHGPMPSLAFRIERDGRSIVYSGDVAEESDALVELARGCDLLIHDFAFPEEEAGPYGKLHAKPSAVGRVATRAGVKRLMVSHIMPQLEDRIVRAIAHVRTSYSGEILEARDLFTLFL